VTLAAGPSGVAPCTIFYVASHGNIENMQTVKFWDGTTGATGPPPGTPVYALAHGSDAAVKPVREAAVGASLPPNLLPPFNPTGNPPIAFAWVDACVTGWSPAFFEAFCYPSKNRHKPDQVENQVAAGWDGFVSNQVCAYFAARFWVHVGQGKTVELARNAARSETNTWYQGNNDGLPFTDDLRLHGDLKSRLRHVYTGTDTLPPVLPGGSPWYRIIVDASETAGW
jgi:hypothetical protein